MSNSMNLYFLSHYHLDLFHAYSRRGPRHEMSSRIAGGWWALSSPGPRCRKQLLLHAPAYCLGQLFFVLPRPFQCVTNAEAGWLLSWRELFKSFQELPDDRLRGNQEEAAISYPLAIEHGGVLIC